MSRRNAIQLSESERTEFLAQQRTIVLSTIDRHGYPHSVAMWYAMEDGCCVMTTYAKAQKAVNIRRNPKVLWGLSNAQLASAGSILAGIAIVIWAATRRDVTEKSVLAIEKPA